MESRARRARAETANLNQTSDFDRIKQNQRDQKRIDELVELDVLRESDAWKKFIAMQAGELDHFTHEIAYSKNKDELLKMSGQLHVLLRIVNTDKDHTKEIEELRKSIRIRSENA